MVQMPDSGSFGEKSGFISINPHYPFQCSLDIDQKDVKLLLVLLFDSFVVIIPFYLPGF